MERSKPHLHVTAEDLPEIKDWEVGETYRMEVVAKQTSFDEHIGFDSKKIRKSASFEITKIKPIGSQSKMEKLEKRFK